MDSKYLAVVRESFEFLQESTKKFDTTLPKNVRTARGELLLRNLDCAVIEAVHEIDRRLDRPGYDSVRGVFFEGDELYENAGFREKNHIQIAIRDQNCIKGFFIPRDLK